MARGYGLLLGVEKSRGGGSPGAMPAYDSSGAKSESATLAGNHSVTLPATINAGDLLIVAAVGRNSNADAALALSSTDLSAGWAYFSGFPFQSGSGNTAVLMAWLSASGSEDGSTITVVGSGGATNDNFLAVASRYTAANGFAATPYESDSGLLTDDVSDTSVSMPTVTPTSTNRRAVAYLIQLDDNAVTASTGESGGDWTAANEVSTTSGPDAGIEIQTSDQSGGGAISGGTSTLAASAFAYRQGFALVPATV